MAHGPRSAGIHSLVKAPDHKGWCHQCGCEFPFEVVHCGFNNSSYAYCDDCGTVALLAAGHEDKHGIPRHRAIAVEGEAQLSACPCGGRFAAGASPRCPHCREVLDPEQAAEYIEAAIRQVAAGWNWQRNWEGLYCLVVDRRVVYDSLKPSAVSLRAVEEGDLPTLFEQQRDPEATKMAALPARDREAFMAHWKKILADDNVTVRTILAGAEIAGNVVCFERSGQWLVGYWLGREFWGRGIASRAVSEFVSSISIRPLHAYVAKHNVASARVLEKCGFELSGECRSGAESRGDPVDELIYTLAE
ncbi:MAG: GNAT family N-acetyltransferase [bacterium]|nr:GNAT family N-acetyltransferase [bacterium]